MRYDINMINIPRDINDPFYRYQRPKISAEPAKLGIKLMNLKDVGKSLELSDKSLMKFFQKKNGCKSKNDILFNKNLKCSDLEDQIEELINLLICKKCNNPEFTLYSEKKKSFIKCKACGNDVELKEDLKKILAYDLESKPSKKSMTIEEELKQFNTNILGDII